MAVIEKHIGRSSTGKTSQRQYRLTGYATDAEARAALLAAVPTTLDGKVLVPSDCEVEEDSYGLYTGIAKYVSPEAEPSQQPVGSFSVSFDIGTQTTTVQYGTAAGTTYKAGSTPARNFGGAINVDSDGKVAGVEIMKPVMTFVLNYTVDPSLITDAYVAGLMNYVGHVNSDVFKTCAAGSLLLTRVSGQRRDGENWDISFAFAVQKNRTNITIPSPDGNNITVATKKGWHYLWIYSEEKENTSTHIIETIPLYATVTPVYDEVAYSGLGLP